MISLKKYIYFLAFYHSLEHYNTLQNKLQPYFERKNTLSRVFFYLYVSFSPFTFQFLPRCRRSSEILPLQSSSNGSQSKRPNR